MSLAEILSLVSLISFIVAGISFAIAVFLWIYFKIPSVIGDLSGRTAKRSIARMRANNEKSGSKSFRSSSTNLNRGKLTDTMPNSDKLMRGQKKAKTQEDGRPETGVLNENKADALKYEETNTLDSNTTGLLIDEDATMPLDSPVPPSVERSGGKKLTIIEDIELIHTDEVIE